MTAFDRIERRLPELLDELAPASLPDYFDDMLQAAARSRQRPAWSAPERWLPMGVIARPLPNRPIPWRMIAIVAAIGLLAATALLYVGSQRRIPAPFGPAANGALAIGTADGDIATVDLVTGRTSALIGGPSYDSFPYFLNDGSRLLFDRRTSATDAAASIFIADADGSNGRELFAPAASVSWAGISPDGGRAFGVVKVAGHGRVAIADVANARRTELDLGLDVVSATWRPNHEQLVVTAAAGSVAVEAGGSVGYWVVNTDGSGLRSIAASKYAINEPTLSPDGRTLAYATWEPTPGPIRVVDIDAGGDHPLPTDTFATYLWQEPQFLPDGTKLLAYQFLQESDPPVAQVAIIDVGTGSVTTMGPTAGNPQPNVHFSPDGTKIVASYSDGRAWIFDIDGRNGRQLTWSAPAGMSWQRVAR